MQSITLHGISFIFDDADWPLVAIRRWYINPQGYACTSVRWPDGRRRTMCLHRYILGDPPAKTIDHINRDPCDNRRVNLRPCSYSENNRNRPTVVGKTSGYRGVSMSSKTGKWQVVVRVSGRLRWLWKYAEESSAGAVAAPYFADIVP